VPCGLVDITDVSVDNTLLSPRSIDGRLVAALSPAGADTARDVIRHHSIMPRDRSPSMILVRRTCPGDIGKN
jgi:hypothetical protein